ncbi:Protein argonaute-2 [Trichinella spiralis]|uniref:Protein argonaute-2 n=1 Tax=Trichinella spiralis TaxID=6334 RepID=A0ABR3KDV0_TRISP
MEFKELVDRRDIMCCLMKATWMRIIPAPVYFADLVCARARYHILAALNSGLVEKFSDEDSKGIIVGTAWEQQQSN